ncbi:hypothetical protein BKA58DRAFT_24470 [Alternaria rosae]|uniref:uncharacterized protein n=1 Tax=Alternaria rosae TaxID=1187941 RepID=UPI001E8D6927|nr:uncharacterized protein BKA58DRAFT_24470 [Alternaria rosae]KAH6882754.1 hypothetical protein BKA58DRAFT_24470 [Alternaria rosae]
MNHRDRTVSFDDDSYFDSSIPMQTSNAGSPLLGPRLAPPNRTTTNPMGPRERRAEYMAARRPTPNPDQYAYNDPGYVSPTPHRTSRRTRLPSSTPERASTSPGAPYARYRGEDNLPNDVVAKVLDPPRGRRTPTLRRAPHIQWDLSGGIRTVTSFTSTGGSVTEEDAVADGRYGDGQAESSQAASSRPRSSNLNHAQQIERGLHVPLLHQDDSTRPSSSNPTLVRQLGRGLLHERLQDAPVYYQNDTQLFSQSLPSPSRRVSSDSETTNPVPNFRRHVLSPIEEERRRKPVPAQDVPDLVPSRRYRHRRHATDSPPTPPEPGSPRPRPRRRHYLPDEYDGDNASLREAEALRIQHVTHEEVRRSERTIAPPPSRDNRPEAGLTVGDSMLEKLWREREADYDELVRRVRKTMKEKHTLKEKAKKCWRKVKKFFGKRIRG